MKIAARNKTLFFALLALVLLFNIILLLGIRRIYETESNWRHGLAESQLQTGRSNIQHFMANFEHHLNFLAKMPAISAFAQSGFESADLKSASEKIAQSLVDVTPHLFSIMIVNSSGRERLRVLKHLGGMLATDTSHEKLNFPEVFFLDKIAFHSLREIGGIVEPADPADMKEPLMYLVKPFSDEDNPHGGFLILSIKTTGLLSLLSDSMFIQTVDDLELSQTPQGSLSVKPGRYLLNDPSGILGISENESIHYMSTEPIPGIKLIVALLHRHIGLKKMLQGLVVSASVLFVLFSGIVALISAASLRGYREKIKTQKALVSSLVELTDFRDPETGRHLERTRNYARWLAERLREDPKFRNVITDDFIEDLYDTAPLHDIGKVAIRDAILLKEGILEKDERKEIEAHVLVGGKIIDDIIRRSGTSDTLMQVAKNIAKHHHEKHNGQGYPYGLKGADIPLEARIFALSDVYDALRSRRPYKQPLTHEEAVDLIIAERGEHFDPDIVDVFIAVQNKFAAASRE
jgi:putative two-component system response regulator